MRFVAFLGSLAAAVGLLGPAAAEGLKIGALMSLSGGLSAYGESSLAGVRLAIDEMNAAGGVNGFRVTLAVADDQTAPQVGIAAARKLIETDKVNAMIGALSSGVTIPVASTVTASAGVLQISTASTSPEITTLKDNDFLFRTVPADTAQGAALAQLTKDKGIKRIALVQLNNSYGRNLADSFTRAFDGSVVHAFAYDPRQGALRAELRAAAKSGADALVVLSYPVEGIAIVKQAADGGLFKRFIFADGMKVPEVVSAFGAKTLEGAFGTAPEAAGDAADAFRKLYRDKHKSPPPRPYVDSAYDAAILLGLAALKAKSNDSMAIRNALRAVAGPPGERIRPGEFAKAKKLIAAGQEIDYAGAAGPQNFDAAGDVAGSYAHWEIKGGKIVTIKVFDPTAR